MNEQKVKTKLTIAGESILLSVPYSQQEETRRTEEELNTLFATWRARFPEKNDRELLAMIAFRYAERYRGLLRERKAVAGNIEDLDRRLGELITAGEKETKQTAAERQERVG